MAPQDDISIFYTNAKEIWLKAEVKTLAYNRAFFADKKKSDYLKIAVVISSILTALSTSLGKSESFYWLTIISAVITATLATIDQQFSFQDKSQKNWRCQTELEKLKSNLNKYALQVSRVENIMNNIDDLSNQHDDIVGDNPVIILDEDREVAEKNFNGTTIDSLLKNLDEDETEDEEEIENVDLPGEESPDIIPADN